MIERRLLKKRPCVVQVYELGAGTAAEQNCENWLYPNTREFFLSNHKHLSGDEYEQRTKPLQVWFRCDSLEEPAIKFLLESGKLSINPRDVMHYFKANFWVTTLYADSLEAVVFYDVSIENGRVTVADFGLVQREIFDADYILL